LPQSPAKSLKVGRVVGKKKGSAEMKKEFVSDGHKRSEKPKPNLVKIASAAPLAGLILVVGSLDAIDASSNEVD
jgi:hypothetical protein